jgi:nuclear pore complex protein Nup85
MYRSIRRRLIITTNSSETSPRDHHILMYAEYLHSDPALWRITVDYMYSCEDIGKQRADEVLLRVPLRLHEQTDPGIERGIKAGDVVGVLKDVNQTCFQYQREGVRRTVCRVGPSYLYDGPFC